MKETIITEKTLTVSKDFLTVKELCEQLQISRNFAYKLIATKGFPAVRIGKRYRISRQGLIDWTKQNAGSQIYLDE